MEFMSTNDTAKRLGIARETVLYYERKGKLSPIRTIGGIRLFPKGQVEKLAEQRHEKQRRESHVAPCGAR